MSASLQSLTNRVTALENENPQIEAEIAAVKADLDQFKIISKSDDDALRALIESVSSRVSTLESSVRTLQTEVNG